MTNFELAVQELLRALKEYSHEHVSIHDRDIQTVKQIIEHRREELRQASIRRRAWFEQSEKARRTGPRESLGEWLARDLKSTR